MFGKLRFLPMVGALVAALAVGGVSATPAVAATDAVRGHELSAVKVAPKQRGDVTVQAVSCQAGVYVDPWSMYFDCVLDTTTNVSARCSDGFTFTPRTLPAGSYRIYVDCYPAFFSSLIFT